MSDKELITVTIDRYTDLQQIKRANGGHENEMLDYLIRVTIAKLSSLGVNVEDITFINFLAHKTKEQSNITGLTALF